MASRKRICIPVSLAKEKGIPVSGARTFEALLRTGEGKAYRLALKAADRNISSKKAKCAQGSLAARMLVSRAEAFIGAHKDEMTAGAKKRLRAQAKAFGKKADQSCKRIARETLAAEKKHKSLLALKGHR